MPRLAPTGTAPWPEKLLTGTIERAVADLAAWFQWATVGSDFPANLAYAAASYQLTPPTGILVLAGRIVAGLPGGRPGPAGPIGHQRHRLLPRMRPTVLDERLPVPELPAAVPATVHEPLELAVGDLVAVHEEIAQRGSA